MTLNIDDLGISISIAGIISDLAAGSATFYRYEENQGLTEFDLPSTTTTTLLVAPFISYKTANTYEERHKFGSTSGGYVKFQMGTVAGQENVKLGDFCQVNFSNGREVVRGVVADFDRGSLSSLIQVFVNIKAKVPAL